MRIRVVMLPCDRKPYITYISTAEINLGAAVGCSVSGPLFVKKIGGHTCLMHDTPEARDKGLPENMCWPGVYGDAVILRRGSSENFGSLTETDAALWYHSAMYSWKESAEGRKPSDQITVLRIDPGRKPELVRISNTLEALQEAVGGYIEAFGTLDGDATFLCCEEGKVLGMPLNRAMRDEDGHVYDVVAGTMLILGTDGEDFGSLPEELVEKYAKRFETPEKFEVTKNGIKVIPVK